MDLMNCIFRAYLDRFVVVFMDDILIYSDNILEYESHVKLVLQCLREAGLQVNIKKTEYYITRTKYLSFIISTEGLEVDLEKITAITD